MIKKFKIPLYAGTLYILKVKSFHDCYKLAKIDKKLWNLFGGDDPDDNYGAIFFQDPDNDPRFFIAINDKTTPAMIAHECVHAVNAVFKYTGIKPDLDNDEPYAYLMGWMFEKAGSIIQST